MKIIAMDSALVGTVDRMEGTRLKLTKQDSPPGHPGHHHFIDLQLGSVEGDVVKFSVNADAVPRFEEERSERSWATAIRSRARGRLSLMPANR
jgi:hypothetical protein